MTVVATGRARAQKTIHTSLLKDHSLVRAQCSAPPLRLRLGYGVR